MRIVSGTHKGRRLKLPKNFSARPTTDFAKEALFNVLNNRLDFEELTVLDLFAGSGSISFEFASRGVKNLIAVDSNSSSIKCIQSNLNQLEFNNMTFIKSDVFGFIGRNKQSYDLIFADPPYALDRLIDIPDLIFKNKLLKPDGILILEHGREHNFSTNEQYVESKKYGNVNFTFFQQQL